MTKKKQNKKGKKLKLVQKKQSWAEKLSIKDETLHFSIAGILLFIAIFALAGAFDSAGPVGSFFYKHLTIFLGIGYYLIPGAFLLMAIAFYADIKRKFHKIKFFGIFLFVISGLGFIDLVSGQGGWLGSILSKTENYFGTGMSIVLSVVLIVISQVILFDSVPRIKLRREKAELEYTESLSEKEEEKIEKSSGLTKKSTKSKKLFNIKEENVDEEEEKKEEKKVFKISGLEKKKLENEGEKMTEKILETGPAGQKVVLPPLRLLSKDKGKPNAGDVKENANIIKSTLMSFGIPVEIEAVSVGPTVTRYSLRPATGVRVSKIAALSDDLALALAAKSILIQTPIPGESLVGIEIPNKNKIMVGAGGLLSSLEYQKSEFALPLAIGKDISGKPVVIGLEKAPHMLIAGTTGAGKSVTVHAILNSLLYKYGPDQLKFILIDPKRVEMTLYNGIPHLLTPVITDPKKAILSLRWAVSEMERRYELLEDYKIRDIESYHKNILEKYKKSGKKSSMEAPETMPYIIVVIDELSDIMQQYPKELESGIVSIAQKARAVGIHLILSTQRPSVNVVTGLIKANIPTRIALQVNSAIDSKTILDMAGAEKLLGKGDMLYMTGSMAKPFRAQSSFISEDEVKSVVRFIKKAYKDVLGDEIKLSGEDPSAQEVSSIDFEEAEDEMEKDSMYDDVKKEVILTGKASTSYIQRRFNLGYPRAAKIIDQLEKKGIIGPANGSKPREVLIKE